jgi:FlaA1/EpsC-like NDP-sugar epimerase
VAPDAEHKVIGIRPGEKIHEQMIGLEDAPYTFVYPGHYKILPMIHDWASDPLRVKDGVRVAVNFVYTSDNNQEWMSVKILQDWIVANKNKIGVA